MSFMFALLVWLRLVFGGGGFLPETLYLSSTNEIDHLVMESFLLLSQLLRSLIVGILIVVQVVCAGFVHNL